MIATKFRSQKESMKEKGNENDWNESGKKKGKEIDLKGRDMIEKKKGIFDI